MASVGSPGQVITACVVGGGLAGWALLRGGLPFVSAVDAHLPDPLLRPLALLFPPLWASHSHFIDKLSKHSTVVMAHTAFGIGAVAATAAAFLAHNAEGLWAMKDDGNSALGLFMGALCIYHLAEFASVALYNPTMLSDDSYLTNERSFVFAMTFAALEYALEMKYYPGIKGHLPCKLIGLAGIMFGEVFRKGALYCGKHNFTHQISDTRKRDEHRLVRSGVYAFSRHPGYFGWFWWSISTQVLLCNPVSTVLFARVAWQFFRERIPYEEHHLTRFFGDDYKRYIKEVPTRIPFIP